MNMASGGLQTRLRLWCLRGEMSGEACELRGSASQLSSFTVFPFLSEGRRLKVEKRLKAGDERKELCSVPWEAGAAHRGRCQGAAPGRLQ